MSSEKPKRNVRPEHLLTGASAITTVNAGLALYGGTHLDTIKGFLAFFAARIGDKGDGMYARWKKQESDAGAIYDTAVDKLGIGVAAFSCWQKEIIPRPAIAAIGARSLASVALTAIMARNHPDESFRPTMAGKIAMGAESATFIAYAGANLLKNNPELITQYRIAQGVGHAALATTIASGTISLVQYAKRAFDK